MTESVIASAATVEVAAARTQTQTIVATMIAGRTGAVSAESTSQWAAQELHWPEEIRIVCTSRGKLNKKDQTLTIQGFIDDSYVAFHVAHACDHGIPKADDRHREQRKLLVKVAKRLKTAKLVERLLQDNTFTTKLLNLAEGRLGSLRGNIKKTANGLVAQQYSLGDKNDTAARVAALLSVCQFIYPGDVLGPSTEMRFNHPFDRDIFPHLLAIHFFNGSSSIASSIEAAGKFPSGLQEKSHEREIPAPMLAIVCAITALAIADWSSGAYAGPRDTNIGVAEEHYSKVMAEITKMKEKSMPMYHRVMHGLYKRVCNLRAAAPAEGDEDRGSRMVIDE
ncbi:hypothetical protein NM688_g4607 [Phlebia brevispora]|uniref:Uncharacterized protein n=1 Tax=Phlebia brevispora TaxID=194682 RepID=A0ACC1T2I3_9APHY|nr:hypothetical protein NM688_g4607 [Phlebia brevispora]